MQDLSVAALQHLGGSQLSPIGIPRYTWGMKKEFKKSIRRIANFESIEINVPDARWFDGWEAISKEFRYEGNVWDIGLISKCTLGDQLDWPRYVFGYRQSGNAATIVKTNITVPANAGHVSGSLEDWETYLRKRFDSTLESELALLSTAEKFHKMLQSYYRKGWSGFFPRKNFRLTKKIEARTVEEFNVAGVAAMFISPGPICLVKSFGQTCLLLGQDGLLEERKLRGSWGETAIRERDLLKLQSDARSRSFLNNREETKLIISALE